jgi:hypothetical protein
MTTPARFADPDAATDGTRSLFAATRTIPYYALGTRTDKRITDYREMMVAAGIDGVRYDKVPAPLPDGAARFVTPTYFNTWVNPFNGETEVVGTVGEKYTNIQPDDVFGIFRDLNHPWDTMGILDGGRSMFGTIAWERDIVLDPNGADEVIKSWLAIKSSNDGSGSLIGGRTSMRFDCFNMFRMMFKGLSDKFRVPHTKSAQTRLAIVRAELNKTDKFYDMVETASREMFQTTLTDDAFWSIVKEEMWPAPEEDKKGAATKWENKMELVAESWNAKQNERIRNTVYGGFQTILEYNQWGRNIQHGRDTVSSVTGLTAGVENFYQAGAGFDTATDNFRGDLFGRFYDLVPADKRTLTV